MRSASIIAVTLLLAACGGGEDSTVTETKMDDIDNLEGTISDEMVDTDALNEQPMIDSSPVEGAKPKAKTGEKAKGEAKAEPAAAPPPLPAGGADGE